MDEYGNTLLMLACQYKHQDLVRILLNKGANPNAKNHSGAYCIHFPCYKDTESLVIAKMLLNAGANPEVAESSYGCTPLHYCASSGNVEFCKLLISFGSFIGTRDFYSYTPVDYAREAGNRAAAAYLQKKFLALTNNAAPGLMVRGISQRSGFQYDAYKPAVPDCDVFKEEEWTSNVDPASGGRYFINVKSGECLWEADFEFLKLQKMLASPAPASQNRNKLSPKASRKNSAEERMSSPATAHQLARADSLRNFGRGASSKDLTPKSSRQEVLKADGSGGGGGLDAATVQKMISEAQLQANKILEDERAKFREELVQKNGKIAKLEFEVESLAHTKETLSAEVGGLKESLSANVTDNEVLASITGELTKEKEEVAGLKFQLAASKSQFAENLSRAQMLAEAANKQVLRIKFIVVILLMLLVRRRRPKNGLQMLFLP